MGIKANEPLVGYRKLCPICGKEFWITRQWAYWRGYEDSAKIYICSWKCLGIWDRDKQKRKGKKKQDDQK